MAKMSVYLVAEVSAEVSMLICCTLSGGLVLAESQDHIAYPADHHEGWVLKNFLCSQSGNSKIKITDITDMLKMLTHCL